MKTVHFTEFRRNVSSYFDSVEEGDSIRIIRHGKLIAQISPLSNDQEKLAWKTPGPRIELDEGSGSEEILRERSMEEDV